MKLKPLELSKNIMWSGYWVMTLGSAAGYEGSVSFGNIVNVTTEDVLITNNISEGSSGGSLIDNEGKVVGIVTWGSDKDREQFNGARNLDTFCSKMIKCEYVDDLAEVLDQMLNNCTCITEKIEQLYERAKNKGQLKPSQSPTQLATDTHLFFIGLLHMWVKDLDGNRFRNRAIELINTHINLRRN